MEGCQVLAELSFSEPAMNARDLIVTVRGQERLLATVGAHSYTGATMIYAGSFRAHVLIGRYTSIAKNVTFIVGLNHELGGVSTYPFEDFLSMQQQRDSDANHAYEDNHYQIIIGNDVWIGEGVTILGGVRIGNGAVIGARAVITKDVPPYAVVVGNSARIVKYRFPRAVIERLERIKWWYWSYSTILERRKEMADAAAFAARYDVPLDPVKNEISSYLKSFRKDGGTVYEFVLDFDNARPLWEKVLDAYLTAKTKADKTLLVLEVPQGLRDRPELETIAQRVEAAGDDAPGITLYEENGLPALDVLPFVDAVITGCTELSSIIVDGAESFGVPVLSGCDHARIFGRPRHTRHAARKQETQTPAKPMSKEERARWERDIHAIFRMEQDGITQLLEQEDWRAAADRMKVLGAQRYEKNEALTDAFLESCLRHIAERITLPPPRDVVHGTVLFYDDFGLDLRGLALIYLHALASLGYHIVYCVSEGHTPLPHIEALLQASGGEKRTLPEGKGREISRCRALCEVFLDCAPEAAFLYTQPHDIGGLLAFQAMAGRTKRYQINLTDHVFWLGVDAFDVCLEFRDYGAKASRLLRGIPAEKLVKQPYYPVVEKDVPFEGYPFEREPGDVVIFSGGQLYKTKDANRTYYHVVDRILTKHRNVKFWYARGGQDDDMDWLLERHPGRAFYTGERKDIYQVIEACDLYLNTYPVGGGLMTQYAAAAGRLPLTLSDTADPFRGILHDSDALDIVRHDVPSFLRLVDELIEHPEERERRSRLARACVLTEEEFTENLGSILKTGTSRFPIRDIDIEKETAINRETFFRKFIAKYGEGVRAVAAGLHGEREN